MQTILGKYELRETIATGSASVVYDGRDTAIERRVAIKAISLAQTGYSEDLQNLIRFRREAQAAGRLQHPAVVGIFDYGESGGYAFIVMEFVDGGTLKSALDDGKRFSMVEINRLMQDILAGLQYSHDQGVIHRDIKPANIMLTRDGRAKITDFGIARIEHSDITQVGTVMGTPSYMSPEQFRGETIGASTDIYSAGVILYQLLTGERPFDGGLATIMHKALSTVAPKPSAISGNVPYAADAVVICAMAKRPDQRYRSAREFARACHEALTVKPVQPVEPPLRALSAGMSTRRATMPANKRLLAGALLAVLLTTGGAATYWFTTSHARYRVGEMPSEAATSSAASAPGSGTAQAPKPAPTPSDTAAAILPGSASSGAGMPAASLEPAPALTPVPSPVLPVPQTVLPATAIPADSESSAPASTPVFPPPSQDQYSSGIANALSAVSPNAPKLSSAPHKLVHKATRQSVVRQPAPPRTDASLAGQAAAALSQPASPPAKDPSRNIDPVSPSTDTAPSSPVVPQQQSVSPVKRFFGTMAIVDGKRVFVPAANPNQ